MSFRDLIVAGEWNNRPAHYRSDQILVRARDSVLPRDVGAAIESVLTDELQGAQVIWVASEWRMAIVRIPNTIDAGQAAIALRGRDGIDFAEPDFLMTGHALALNDTQLSSQKWLDTIHMMEAWELMVSWKLGVGSATDVLLAVFDSGIQMWGGASVDHPDLDASRFVVTHNIGGTVKHDYWRGDPLPADMNGHGTKVAGILAATAGNTKGIAGVNWKSKVYVARVLDDHADTCVGAVLSAMNDLRAFAVDKRYDRIVVNLSLGSSDQTESNSLATMIGLLDMETRRYLLCCAMDSYMDSTNTYHADYPAQYAASKSYVISVAESDIDDNVRLPLEGMVPTVTTEITVVAPGLDAFTTLLHDPANAGAVAYGLGTGTSMAAPMVSGLASLMWTVAPWLTPGQIKSALIDSATTIKRGTIDYFRIDANEALLNVRADITLKTPVLSFVDVYEGSESTQSVAMSATGNYDLTFTVVPDSLAGLDPAFSLLSQSMTWVHGGPDAMGIIVKYTAGVAGSTASGSFRVRLDGSNLEWIIQLSGNAIPLPPVALGLVADTSGSMALASGIGTKTRMTVLQESLTTVIDTLKVGGACALIRFDTDAHLEAPLQGIAQVGAGDAGRTILYAAVGGLVPGGDTSIGDGAKLGNDTAVTDTTRKPAMLVLTDGHENEPAFIDDVMDQITAPVYAIGMGTASVIEPTALGKLADARGGYLLLTDALDDTNQNRVKKYCLQMLAEAAGGTVMMDPPGYVPAGTKVEIPFWLTSHDTHCDVFLLVPEMDAITMELVTPGGKVIAPGSARPGVDFVSGSFVSYYRLNFATSLVNERNGQWLARLYVSKDQLGRYLRNAKKARPELGPRSEAHGVPYDLMVTGHSSIALRARSYADGTAPGSRASIRAVIDGAALIAPKLTTVAAQVQAPDGTAADLSMRDLGRGAYQCEFTAGIPGVYTTQVSARGYTPEGEHFTREQVVTTAVWIEPRANVTTVARDPRHPR